VAHRLDSSPIRPSCLIAHVYLVLGHEICDVPHSQTKIEGMDLRIVVKPTCEEFAVG